MALLWTMLKGFTNAIDLHLLKSRRNVGLQKHLRGTINVAKMHQIKWHDGTNSVDAERNSHLHRPVACNQGLVVTTEGEGTLALEAYERRRERERGHVEEAPCNGNALRRKHDAHGIHGRVKRLRVLPRVERQVRRIVGSAREVARGVVKLAIPAVCAACLRSRWRRNNNHTWR